MCVTTALIISMLHGLSITLGAALPVGMQSTFNNAISIGFGMIEGASIFIFFLYYIMAAFNAWRTRVAAEFVGVQILYGFLSLFLIPILQDLYFEVVGSHAMFSVGATFYTTFMNNIVIIALFFFGVIFVLLNLGKKDGYTQ